MNCLYIEVNIIWQHLNCCLENDKCILPYLQQAYFRESRIRSNCIIFLALFMYFRKKNHIVYLILVEGRGKRGIHTSHAQYCFALGLFVWITTFSLLIMLKSKYTWRDFSSFLLLRVNWSSYKLKWIVATLTAVLNRKETVEWERKIKLRSCHPSLLSDSIEL